MSPQSLYYDGDADVANDEELQAWWTEITTKGHADADSSGWPGNTYEDGIRTVAELSDITTTMAWMASAHHAAGAARVMAWTSRQLTEHTMPWVPRVQTSSRISQISYVCG